MIGGKELPLFEMLFMEEELNAWEKDGRDICGWVATSERFAILQVVDDGEGKGEGGGGAREEDRRGKVR